MAASLIDQNTQLTKSQPESGLTLNNFVVTLLYKTRLSHQAKPNCEYSNGISPAEGPNLELSTLASVSSVSKDHSQKSFSDPDSTEDFSNGSYISSTCLKSFINILSSLLESEHSSILDYSQKIIENSSHPLAVELIFALNPGQKNLAVSSLRKNKLVHQYECEWNVDVIFQDDTVFRRYPRLVCFDMDSTLIEEELIDLIAESIGVEAEVSALTERSMRGEIDFLSSLESRVKLLQGVEDDIFVKLRSVITPTKGIRELLRALKRIGIRTAVFSGGFLPVVSWLAGELGIDYAHANVLSISNNRLTGELEGQVVDAERKRALLYEIAEKEGIDIRQTVAVGDGANDLLMLEAAGLGVAWNAKSVVQMQADAKLNRENISDLLYFFGFTREEINLLAS